MATIVTLRNPSEETRLEVLSLDLALEPGDDKELDLDQVPSLDPLLELARTNQVEVLLDGHTVSADELSDVAWCIMKEQMLLTMRLNIRQLHVKLARSRTLFLQIKDAEELAKVEAWAESLDAQIGEIQALLENAPPARNLNENVNKAIESARNDIIQLEDYLIGRSPRSLRDRLTLRTDYLKPFREDPEKSAPNILERIGFISVHLDDLPGDDNAKALLTARLQEVSRSLDAMTVNPTRPGIARTLGTLKAIESKLPLSNNFLVMFAPILGVFTLQGFIWWFAINGDIGIEKIWGLKHELFLGVVLTGTLGSLARVLFRAINQEYRSYGSYLAIYLIGLIRPILGAVMGLVVVLLFNSTLLPIPVSPGADGTAVIGPLPAEVIFMLFAAFMAGFSDEWVLSLLPRPKE